MVESTSISKLVKGQNFVYDELHVIIFALSKFDQVRYDFYEQVRKAISEKRTQITKEYKQGTERKAILNEFDAGKAALEKELMDKFLKEGTQQRMADLPAVVNDAVQAIDYSLNELGCQPNNLHLFALPEDQEKIKARIVDDDHGMDEIPIKENPDKYVQMMWRTTVKAKYDFMFDKCLSDEQRQMINENNQIRCHEPTVTEWKNQFDQIINRGKQTKDDGSPIKILLLQFFAGHGMQSQNGQVLLANEFDEKNEWYKFLEVEATVRTYAKFNSNIYLLTTFACCREKYYPKKNEDREQQQHRGISVKMMEEKMKMILAEENLNKDSQKLELAKVLAAEDGFKYEQQDMDSMPEARGGAVTGMASNKTVNFCFIFGCQPGEGVLAKTQLIRDLTEHLKENNKDCIIPTTFDLIESNDAGFETVASNMGQNLQIESLSDQVGQLTCFYFQYKTRTQERDKQKKEAMRFCKECLQMDDEDIIVFDHEEFLWFWYEAWGDKPLLKLDTESENKELSEL